MNLACATISIIDMNKIILRRPIKGCIGEMVADTAKWEQSTGFMLDAHPGVIRWVKNDYSGKCDRLDFTIPYRKRNIRKQYVPDFIAVTDSGNNVIIETKGQYNDDADIKAKAAERWVEAVNRLGIYGTWHYLLVNDPSATGIGLNAYTKAQWGPIRLNL